MITSPNKAFYSLTLAAALVALGSDALNAQASFPASNDLPNPYMPIDGWAKMPAVSYTHLTLPTNREV